MNLQQLRHSLRLLAACARQQQSLAAIVVHEAAAAVATAQQPASLQLSNSTTAAWRRSFSSHQQQPPGDPATAEDLPDAGDSYYWVPPTEEQPGFSLDRRNIAERRALGELLLGTAAAAPAVACHSFVRSTRTTQQHQVVWSRPWRL